MEKADSGRTPPITTDYDEAVQLIRAGRRLDAETLACLLEGNPAIAVPDTVRQHLVGLLRGKATLPRGRKSKNDARLDFILWDAIDLYEEVLLKFQAEDAEKRKLKKSSSWRPPKAEEPASLRAAQCVAEQMHGQLGNIGAKRLLNLMSTFKRREFPVELQAPPDEFDPPDHISAPHGPNEII